MPRRWIRFIRQVGAIILAVLGYGSSSAVWPFVERQLVAQGLEPFGHVVQLLLGISLGMFGFGFGYLLAPTVLRPLDIAYEELSQVPPVRLLGAAVGLGVGLFLGALAAFPLAQLRAPLGQFLPFIVAVTLAYLGAATVGNNPGAFLALLRSTLGLRDQARWIAHCGARRSSSRRRGQRAWGSESMKAHVPCRYMCVSRTATTVCWKAPSSRSLPKSR